jgi:hypothetical protein
MTSDAAVFLRSWILHARNAYILTESSVPTASLFDVDQLAPPEAGMLTQVSSGAPHDRYERTAACY